MSLPYDKEAFDNYKLDNGFPEKMPCEECDAFFSEDLLEDVTFLNEDGDKMCLAVCDLCRYNLVPRYRKD